MIPTSWLVQRSGRTLDRCFVFLNGWMEVEKVPVIPQPHLRPREVPVLALLGVCVCIKHSSDLLTTTRWRTDYKYSWLLVTELCFLVVVISKKKIVQVITWWVTVVFGWWLVFKTTVFKVVQHLWLGIKYYFRPKTCFGSMTGLQIQRVVYKPQKELV